MLFFLVFLLILWTILPRGFVRQAYFEILHFLDEKRWSPCRLRKVPTVLQVDQVAYAAVWESNCKAPEMTFCLQKPEDIMGENCFQVKYSELDETHFVFRTEFYCETPGIYKYRVNKEVSSSFRIRPAHAAEGRLALISDNQSGTATFISLLSQISQHSPERIVFGGDFAQNPELREIQLHFFDPVSLNSLGSTTPLTLTFGNHDSNSRVLGRYFGMAPRYFSFCHAGSFIIILDSRTNSPQQEWWLQAQMESKEFREAPFRIVFVHIAPFVEFWNPKAWERGEKNWGSFVKRVWVPLFEKYSVDMVISGHEHAYQRGERNGVTYAIIGGGGGELDYERVEDHGFYAVTRSVHHYVIVDLTSAELHWTARDLRGNVVDEFVLRAKLKAV